MDRRREGLSSSTPNLCTSKYDAQNHLVRGFLDQINAKVPVECDAPEEIDVVISGGGMKGYFVVGAWSVLFHTLKEKRFTVKRWAGTSVGAASAIYMCCGVDPVIWSNTYWRTRRLIRSQGTSIVESFRILSHELLPDNAHELCTGKVFLSITLLTVLGPKNVIVSEFYSKEDLIDACVASCSIPYMTSNNLLSTFRGMRVLDGGFTNNTPYFTDNARRQLVMHTTRVPYPSGLVLNMKDPCIDSLVMRGAFMMRQFITGEYCPTTGAVIEWKEVEELSPVDSTENSNWQNRIRKGVRSFSVSSLIKLSGMPSGEMFELQSMQKPPMEEDESTMHLVSNELKRTLAHYRMAIIILVFSTILMTTPVKWEDTRAWKRLFSRILFFRSQKPRLSM